MFPSPSNPMVAPLIRRPTDCCQLPVWTDAASSTNSRSKDAASSQLQLSGVGSAHLGAADADSASTCRVEVHGRVAHAGRDDQPNPRERIDRGGRHRCPLAHQAHNVKGQEAGDDLVGIGPMFVEEGDLGSPIEGLQSARDSATR